MKSVIYEESAPPAAWQGVALAAGDEFELFFSTHVAERLHDVTGLTGFSEHLTGLASTGFAVERLQEILDAEDTEERPWAICEAVAEAWLTLEHGAIWPWNMCLDKRTPNASLPGPDLIGFITVAGQVRLLLGEVKSSSDLRTPPGVMTGRTGMTKQLESIAQDLSLLFTLLRWLKPRCLSDEHRALFNSAVTPILQSENADMALFGVLIRDTPPHALDLRNRGTHLATVVAAPAECKLIAIYLPCPIDSLAASAVTGGSA